MAVLVDLSHSNMVHYTQIKIMFLLYANCIQSSCLWHAIVACDIPSCEEQSEQ